MMRQRKIISANVIYNHISVLAETSDGIIKVGECDVERDEVIDDIVADMLTNADLPNDKAHTYVKVTEMARKYTWNVLDILPYAIENKNESEEA
ncbi:MAG: hypothetical protein NC131_11495 [Roseburia sp.]|nr:hypothetical protein [Roseburia sp.]